MNKVIYSRPLIIGFIVLSSVCLADTSVLVKDVNAPPFGGPKFSAPRDLAPRDLAPRDLAPRDLAPRDLAPRDLQTTRALEENLKHSITAENLVRLEDRPVVREKKINNILHELDKSSESLSVQLEGGIWRDAYTFSNTVIEPLIGVAKFLVFFFYDTNSKSFVG